MQIGIPFLPSFHLLMSDACYFSNGDVALFTQTPIKQFRGISEDGVGADGQGGHPLGSQSCVHPSCHTPCVSSFLLPWHRDNCGSSQWVFSRYRKVGEDWNFNKGCAAD